MACETRNKTRHCVNPTSDQCVQYTGPEIPALGICTGLWLDELEVIILERLQELAKGEGIALEDITANCAFVQTTLAASDKSLFSLIQGLYDNQCTLRSLIQALEDNVEPPFTFDLKCLTVPTVPNRDNVTQAIINEVCLQKTEIEQIKDNLANDESENSILNAVKDLVGNMVKEMLSSCQGGISSTGSGIDTKITINAQVPIGTILHGKYEQSWFDSTGLGLSQFGMCGYAVTNGQNGTVDTRGYTLASTISAPGTLPLDARVAPGPGIALSPSPYLGKEGRTYGVLSSSQIPDHTHKTIEEAHKHTYSDYRLVSSSGNIYPSPDGLDRGGPVQASLNTVDTSSVLTNLQVGGVTGTSGQPIDFRQPTLYVRTIQRIA